MNREPGGPADGGRDRRAFLRGGSLGALGFSSVLQALLARPAAARGRTQHLLGRAGSTLQPVPDETTGLPLLALPAGFRYASFGWFRDAMASGGPTPPAHDGMAVVHRDAAGVLTLVRNHERREAGSPFGTSDIQYDSRGSGGTSTLRFDPRRGGAWLDARPSLGGTVGNCAGGVTPWGSWLSCEESLAGGSTGFQRPHGWIFEVPALQTARPVPLRAMGRFLHEAVAIDPNTGFVYETEDDKYTSGLYRFRPFGRRSVSALEAGGALEMLAVLGMPNADLELARPGQAFDVEWVPVADPALDPQNGVGPFGSFDGQTTSCSGPFLQGFLAGGARFRRLEGAWFDVFDGALYFVDTEGGLPAPDSGHPEGAIWRYEPGRERLSVVYASPAESVLDSPDNLTVTPGGAILLCEDGDRLGTHLITIDRRGIVAPFARNEVVLAGQVNNLTGDFRGSEWCGASFDPSGEWLFVNLQEPGITVAITGPWGALGL